MNLIAGFGLIFWQFAPKNEVAVSYSPWFLDQVDEDNIKSLSLQGLEVRGELRRKVTYHPPTGTGPQRRGAGVHRVGSEHQVVGVRRRVGDCTGRARMHRRVRGARRRTGAGPRSTGARGTR